MGRDLALFGMERSIALVDIKGRSLFWYGKVDRSFFHRKVDRSFGMERSIATN
ncbi:hypothetical protein QUB63_24380 [Microcoleus sp. ARI1-B5]|uniref:hypothetical protein n=1 Tax=unclassified Microcoleus TaxID=2642155 RepID=UPI002FD32D3C